MINLLQRILQNGNAVRLDIQYRYEVTEYKYLMTDEPANHSGIDKLHQDTLLKQE